MLPSVEMLAHDDNDEIIDLWTSEFLKDFDNCRPKSAGHTTSKPHVAFGRTTHEIHLKLRPKTAPILPGRVFNKRMTLHLPTKLSDSRIQQTNEYLTRISEQQSKVRGTQMLNFKIDVSKAREKRKRQLQYSNEIKAGSTSLQSREIDSVTRIVVQSFRKLIACERCALFLMDEKTNELYFKPVGDSDHSHARLKELRFPASSGVAGWVASNKKMLNIKNAYHDARFNADVDKKTGFRTRTILCHPVLSSTNQLLGVIQMVNKKRNNPNILEDKAKKKGYQSCFEHFSAQDEEILGKCSSEVSKSLQEIFSQRDRKQTESKSDEKRDVIFFSDEGVISPLTSSCVARSHQVNVETRNDQGSVEQSTESDSTSYIPEPPRRDSARRRSSVGDLAHFIKQNCLKKATEGQDVNAVTHGSGINEAVLKFRLRPADMESLRHREIERRLSDTGFLVAESKRKRMKDYGQQTRRHDPAKRSSSVGEVPHFVKQSSDQDTAKAIFVKRNSTEDTAGVINFATHSTRTTETVYEKLQRRLSDPGFMYT